MIDSSYFTYLPPLHSEESNFAFLGFSRYGNEDQITEESWAELTESVSAKVLNTMKKEYRLCTCCAIQFDVDPAEVGILSGKTETGILLKKIKPPRVKELSEIAMRQFSAMQPTAREAYPPETSKKNMDCALKRLDYKGIKYTGSFQNEFNECVVKALYEVSSKMGIEIPRILKQVQQAKDEGYLSVESFDKLQSGYFTQLCETMANCEK